MCVEKTFWLVGKLINQLVHWMVRNCSIIKSFK